MNVMTIGSMSHLCCTDRMVTVSTEEGSSAKISVLVVRGKPLGFDLLLGIDTIKALGGMVVGPTGSFNHWSQAWTVAWKWSEGHTPEALDNRVAEYLVVAGGLRVGAPHIDEQWLACYIQRGRTGNAPKS